MSASHQDHLAEVCPRRPEDQLDTTACVHMAGTVTVSPNPGADPLLSIWDRNSAPTRGGSVVSHDPKQCWQVEPARTPDMLQKITNGRSDPRRAKARQDLSCTMGETVFRACQPAPFTNEFSRTVQWQLQRARQKKKLRTLWITGQKTTHCRSPAAAVRSLGSSENPWSQCNATSVLPRLA